MVNDPVGFDISRQQQEYVRAGRNGDVVVVSLPFTPGRDLASVNAGLRREVERHEILRTTLIRTAGLTLPLQAVHESLPFGWRDGVEDVRALVAELDPERGPVLIAATSAGPDPSLVLVASAAVADVATLHQLARVALGEEPAIADPIQYAEYSAWQAERLAEDGDDAQAAGTAWHGITGGDAVELVPTELHDSISLDDTPNAAPDGRILAGPPDIDHWLADWSLTVARLTGKTTVTIGVELDPRDDDELAGAAGPYLVVRPIQLDIPVTGSLAEFRTEVASVRGLAQAWVEWAPSSAPDCPVLFGLGPVGSRAARGAHQIELRVDPLTGAAEVVAGPAAAAALADTVVAALRSVRSAGPDTPIADIDVVTAAETAARLALRTEPAASGHLLDRLAELAVAAPDRVAVSDGGMALTYAELVQRVDGLAGALVAAGAGAAAPVGIALPRSVEFIVAMLAAQRAGAGYLPLDLEQPPARIEQQLRSAASSIVIGAEAADGAEGEPQTYGGRTVIMVSSGVDGAVLPVLSGDDTAYVIFTSGSTGVPKGVRVPARALTNYAAAISELVDGGAPGRARSWALMSSPSTDLGNTAIFPALVSGGTLHVVPTPDTRDPRRLAAYLAAHPIDVMKITPSQLSALLVDDDAEVLPRDLLLLGGEALPWSLVDEIRRRGGCRIANHYGPTETTVGVLVNPLAPDARPETDRAGGTVALGHPLRGNEVLVLDARRRLVPPGATGQIAVGGAGLAEGYVGDPDGTAERFVPHPYRAGERIYLTGDLARQATDGSVSFLGRGDGQVKIRGYRVEVGEIEAALRTHPSIRQAAVVLRDDIGANPQLIGYVVTQVHPSPPEAELQDHLRTLVPDYMVPTRIVDLDALPLRPNGKLDTAALPVPPSDPAPMHVDPATESESVVAAIFCDVLHLPAVSVTDDFFALGGHSLQATNIVVAVRSALGVDLPVYSVFEAPTVRGIAELADRGRYTSVDDAELQRMIAELDELTDEEAAALLEKEVRERPGE